MSSKLFLTTLAVVCAVSAALAHADGDMDKIKAKAMTLAQKRLVGQAIEDILDRSMKDVADMKKATPGFTGEWMLFFSLFNKYGDQSSYPKDHEKEIIADLKASIPDGKITDPVRDRGYVKFKKEAEALKARLSSHQDIQPEDAYELVKLAAIEDRLSGRFVTAHEFPAEKAFYEARVAFLSKIHEKYGLGAITSLPAEEDVMGAKYHEIEAQQAAPTPKSKPKTDAGQTGL